MSREIRNCNVCVVGGAGFLGSHLVNHLVEDRDCRVMVIDNLEVGRREFVHPKAEFKWHDITGSEEYLKQSFLEMFEGLPGGAYHCAPLYVFNYCARPYVPDSFDRPIRTCDVNFMGALHVINAAQEAGADGILQVSSAEIYGAGDPHTGNVDEKGNACSAIDESAPVEPHSSYGASKAAIDALVQVRWKEAKTPCIALRQFNAVGERETHPYIVPEIISQLAKQQTVCSSCKGSGVYHPNPDKLEQVCATCEGRKWYNEKNQLSCFSGKVKLGNNSFRDFLYAGDAVRIAVELLERGEFGEVYNLGSETGIKMYDLAKLIGKVMGFSDVKVEVDQDRVRPWEIWHLQSCNAKIWNAIYGKVGQPRINPLPPSATGPKLFTLEESLKRTIACYEQSGRKWCWE